MPRAEPSPRTIARRTLDALRARVFAVTTPAECYALESELVTDGALDLLTELDREELRRQLRAARRAFALDREAFEAFATAVDAPDERHPAHVPAPPVALVVELGADIFEASTLDQWRAAVEAVAARRHELSAPELDHLRALARERRHEINQVRFAHAAPIVTAPSAHARICD